MDDKILLAEQLRSLADAIETNDTDFVDELVIDCIAGLKTVDLS
jgi:hypothetical protein